MESDPLDLLFLALPGDHQVLDLVVGSLRKNAFGNQVVLAAIRPARYDFFRICVPDARKFLKLIRSRAIQIHQWARLSRSLGWCLARAFGLRPRWHSKENRHHKSQQRK